MLEEILILLDKLLASQPAILIKQVYLQNLLLVFSISRTEQGCNNEGEKVSECSESHVLGKDVVIV
jgi:hypothetical protein